MLEVKVKVKFRFLTPSAGPGSVALDRRTRESATRYHNAQVTGLVH